MVAVDRQELNRSGQKLGKMKDTANKKYEKLFDDNELDVSSDKERNEDAALKEVSVS